MKRGLLVCGSLCLMVVLSGGCHSARDEHRRHSASGAEADPPTFAITSAEESVPTGWSQIGESVQHRPILARTIGSGELRVLLVGGIHGTELEGLNALDSIVNHLEAKRWPVTIRVIRDVNPDGTALKRRGNVHGVDLNRNFPAGSFRARRSHGTQPLSEPESRTLHGEIERLRPQLVIVFHSISEGPFVNFDGPAEEAAYAFVSAAHGTDSRWRVVPSMGYATPGSLGQWVGVDKGLPILTIEFDRGQRTESVELAAKAGIDAVLQEMTRPARMRSRRQEGD